MATYFLFGNYSVESMNEMDIKRTEKAITVIEKHGGKFIAGYALLGDTDLILIVDLPNPEQAMKTSVALSKMLGIGFTTSPAVSFEAFDKLIEDV